MTYKDLRKVIGLCNVTIIQGGYTQFYNRNADSDIAKQYDDYIVKSIDVEKYHVADPNIRVWLDYTKE